MPRPKQSKPKLHERSWGEGTVRELPSGGWYARRRRAAGPGGAVSRPARTFDTKADAVAWARGDDLPEVMLLGQWLNHWLGLRWPLLRPNTQQNYKRFVAACDPLAGIPLADLTVDDWQALTNTLLARWARSHVKNWRKAISSALRAALSRHLDHNPMIGTRLPKAVDEPVKVWRRAEFDRLIAAAHGGRHETWLLVALGTGTRLGELRALEWADVDMVGRTMRISKSLDNQDSSVGPTKTGKHRTIEFPDELVPVLRAQRARQAAGERYVFGRDGRVPHPVTIRTWLRRICRVAGVTVLTPHATRHSYATLALDRGVSIQDVAYQLGHASVQTTMLTYSHFIGHGQRRISTAVGAMFSEALAAPISEIGSQDGSRGTG
jgi:integrase